MTSGILNRFKTTLDQSRLGELLVLNGKITEQQLTLALARQRDHNQPLGRYLLQQNIIARHDLYQALIQQWAMRATLAAVTIMLTFAAYGIKPARADMIRDVPAQVKLANVANAAFAPVASYPALFGSDERKSRNLKPFTKWTEMFDRFDTAMQTAAGIRTMDKMKKDLESLQGKPLRVMAQQVDRLMNKLPYIEDSQNWGKSDYWATPIEFMTKGGDCEDFAIAKYTALRALGVPEERLRVAIVQDLEKDIPHAILIVYADEGMMILDNQSRVTRFADNVDNYRPIFSINRQGWWLHSAPKNTILASVQ